MTHNEMVRAGRRFFAELGRADAIAGLAVPRDGPALRLLLERLVEPYGFTAPHPFIAALNAYPPAYRRAQRDGHEERALARLEFGLWDDPARGPYFACLTCGSDPANASAPRYGISSEAIATHLLSVGHRARASS